MTVVEKFSALDRKVLERFLSAIAAVDISVIGGAVRTHQSRPATDWEWIQFGEDESSGLIVAEGTTLDSLLERIAQPTADGSK